jgi:hypothetical protein
MFSQNESKNIVLGLNFNPNIMYRTSWVKPGYEGDLDYKKFFKYDYPIFGYNYGLSLIFKRSQIYEIESGIFISQRGYGYQDKIDVPDSIANFEYDPGFLYPEEFKIRNIGNFLDIPVEIRRDILGRNRITLYVKGGISLNILLNQKRFTHVYYIDDTETNYLYNIKFQELKDHKYRFLNLSTLISGGSNISVYKNIGIQIEAIVNYSILPVSKDGDVSARFFEAGIKTGISYDF